MRALPPTRERISSFPAAYYQPISGDYVLAFLWSLPSTPIIVRHVDFVPFGNTNEAPVGSVLKVRVPLFTPANSTVAGNVPLPTVSAFTAPYLSPDVFAIGKGEFHSLTVIAGEQIFPFSLNCDLLVPPHPWFAAYVPLPSVIFPHPYIAQLEYEEAQIQ